MVVVVLTQRNYKPQIKSLLDKMGIPSQFVMSETLQKAMGG